MRSVLLNIGIIFLGLLLITVDVTAQSNERVWSLEDCINFAFENNPDIQKAVLNSEKKMVSSNQVRASRFPSVSASVRQNFSSDILYGDNTGQSASSETGIISYNLSSSVVLFNGFKTKNNIRQAALNCQSGQYDIEIIKETVCLNILDAYLQILYAEEQVSTSRKQADATTGQLQLSEERMKLGAISKADYLQVKSQLATEKLALTNAENLLVINRLNLMQLMEVPASSDFSIAQPVFSDSLKLLNFPVSDSIYSIALKNKPQIKNAELNTQITALNEQIAKSGYYPQLSVSAGIGNTYSGLSSYTTYEQDILDKIFPSIGITLSIPVYQNKQVSSEVQMAKIETRIAGISELTTKNNLRKNVEQACVDVVAARKEYESCAGQYEVSLESYQVASEKYTQGLMNAVDFLTTKTSLNLAESKLLQSKYNLIFNYKRLGFYMGTPITL